MHHNGVFEGFKANLLGVAVGGYTVRVGDVQLVPELSERGEPGVEN